MGFGFTKTSVYCDMCVDKYHSAVEGQQLDLNDAVLYCQSCNKQLCAGCDHILHRCHPTHIRLVLHTLANDCRLFILFIVKDQ